MQKMQSNFLQKHFLACVLFPYFFFFDFALLSSLFFFSLKVRVAVQIVNVTSDIGRLSLQEEDNNQNFLDL